MSEANKIIPYESKLHAAIVPRLQARIKKARDAMSTRSEQWARNEEQFMAYMPAKENDRLREGKRKQGEPQFTTIEIPYSYAIVLTAHTYITSTFLSRTPVIQLAGRHGEAQNAEMAMEALLDYQTQTGKHLVPYYVWTLDALKYGLGIVGTYWDEERMIVRKRQQVERTFLGIPVPGTKQTVDVEEEVRGYVGNRLYNIRPFDWFPDPSYPISQFQKGEFCGRFVSVAWLDIVDGEKRGEYFNLAALKANRRQSYSLRVDGSSRVDLPGKPSPVVPHDDYDTGNVDCHELYVRLVPKDWGLGSSTRSEKWVFLLAEDNILISARPLGYYHNKFPFAVLEQEVDGHSLFARSMLEVMKPLNDTLTWLLNSHFYNVRKALNDQFVVDPSRVVMKDMTDPNAGKLIRLKPAAYGTDPKLSITQLPVTDVTRAHLADAQLVEMMLQRVSGVNDNIMGMMGSSRKTATEVRSSTTFSVNRLKTTTEYMSAMGFGPLTELLVQQTQQLYDDDRKYRVVGDAAQYMNERFINITPEAIAGFFDFVPVDGTLPVDRTAQVNLWTQMFAQAQAFPQIMAGYDFVKIFAFVGQLAGLKNIQQFRVQVVPDATMQNAMMAGNSVPAMPTDLEGVDANGGNVQPPQVPGMGQAL
jgi:hypothetical protein